MFQTLTGEQVNVFLAAAQNLAEQLPARGFKSGDTVLFIGDSPGWIYNAFVAMGHSKRFRARQLPISGKFYVDRFALFKRKAGDDSEGFWKQALRPAFPTGLKGTIWMVDHSRSNDPSILQVAKLFEHIDKTLCTVHHPYQLKFLRLVGVSDQNKQFTALPSQLISEVGRVILRNPEGHASEVDFEMDVSNRYLPGSCPKFEYKSWSTMDLAAAWSSQFQKGSLSSRAKIDIAIGAAAWRIKPKVQAAAQARKQGAPVKR